MSAAPVEWVLVIRFSSTAHRAVYGRLSGSKLYSKDYIQLSKKADFVDDLVFAFPSLQGSANSMPITYCWPSGEAPGKLQKQSADRPHLAWVTNNPPPPWRMSKASSSFTVETIKGDPTHRNEESAELEFEHLVSSGFGQPFLIAVKLKDELARLHIRVVIEDPNPDFEWADLRNNPPKIQELAATTSKQSALAWYLFKGDDASTLYFDPSSKTDPWSDQPPFVSANQQDDGMPLAPVVSATAQAMVLDSDSTAESLDLSDAEVAKFEQKLKEGDYGVPDSIATVKTRGSAQRVFARNVKDNYGWRCAATGIKKREFLIASHIVPWSFDESIRLDPANGICFSVLVDRAFEHGYIVIQDDLTIAVAWTLVGDDAKLAKQLGPLDGIKLDAPKAHAPKVEYLARRRALHIPTSGELP